MKEVKPPEEGAPGGIFLAGGITNCPDWQREAVDLLESTEGGVLYNPRRENFTPDIGEAQILWEYRHLDRARMIFFWFPEETLCPITLYELGRWAHSTKPLIVGCDPGYKRRFDVEVQLRLARPEVKVHTSLTDTVLALRAQWMWLASVDRKL